jgi:hypothetical protein
MIGFHKEKNVIVLRKCLTKELPSPLSNEVSNFWDIYMTSSVILEAG